MAGSQSLAGENETTVSGENASPSRASPFRASVFCTAASTSRLLFRKPCHAIQTRPVESVAATGLRSAPGSDVRRISGSSTPLRLARAYRSELPLRRADQMVHTRFCRQRRWPAPRRSSPRGETGTGESHLRLAIE